MKNPELLYLGSTPVYEDCVQVNPREDYYSQMNKENWRYIHMLRNRFPVPSNLKEEVHFRMKVEQHEFGWYTEAVILFNADNPMAVQMAMFVESNLPESWSDDTVFKTSDYFEDQIWKS